MTENNIGTPTDTRMCARASVLSERELQVLTLLANGKTSGETAAALAISKRTLEDHVRHACEKLKALNRVHAIALASKAGLINLQPS
jgi:LuxR family quorum sensing-dependent transcriptional regulator